MTQSNGTHTNGTHTNGATNGSSNGAANVSYKNGTHKHNHVDSLVDKVNKSVGTFQGGHTEKDRLAALRAAQELVRALHGPKDNVYHLVYSVRTPSHTHLTDTSNLSTSPPKPCACALASTWKYSLRSVKPLGR
jgi:hypothetical protein